MLKGQKDKIFVEDTLKQVSYTFIVKVAGAFIGVLVQISLARSLGVSQFGVYAYTVNWIMVLAIFSNLGLHLPIIRFIAEYSVNQQFGLIRGILRRVLQLVLIATLLVAIGYMSIVQFQNREITSEFYSTMMVGIFLLPVMTLIQTGKSFLFAFQKAALGLLPDVVLRHMLTISGVMFILAYGAKFKANNAMFLVTLTGLIAMGVTFLCLQYARPVESLRCKPEYHTTLWLKTGLPFLWVALAELLMSRTDILVLGMLRPATEIGIYVSASLIASSLSIIITSVESVTGPKFAEFFAQQKYSEAQQLLTYMTKGLTITIFPIAITLILTGRWVMLLFGRDFTGGDVVLLVLISNQLIFLVAPSLGQLMGISGNQKIFAWVMTIAGLLNIGFSFLLIPALGLVGAALARMIAVVFITSTLGYFLWKREGLMPTIFANFILKWMKNARDVTV